MMNTILVANWKLYVSTRRSVALAKNITQRFGKKRFQQITQVLCPSDPILEEVGKVIHSSLIHLGAQNIGIAVRGAATGEVSAQDLKQLGCRYVIVGHSERRAAGETDVIVAKKLQLAAANGLIPILCVGEPRSVREKHRHQAFVERQLRRVLAGFHGTRLIIAYEPIWAISQSGKTRRACSPEVADAMHRIILHSIQRLRKRKWQNTPILYGGSVNGRNISTYVHRGGFDGALVGFASTKIPEYGTMLRVMNGG